MNGGLVGRTHFEEDDFRTHAACGLDQVVQDQVPQSLALRAGTYTDIQDMRLADRHGHDGIAVDDPVLLQHLAKIADPQAVTKDSACPRMLVGFCLDSHDVRDILFQHRAKLQETRA